MSFIMDGCQLHQQLPPLPSSPPPPLTPPLFVQHSRSEKDLDELCLRLSGTLDVPSTSHIIRSATVGYGLATNDLDQCVKYGKFIKIRQVNYIILF